MGCRAVRVAKDSLILKNRELWMEAPPEWRLVAIWLEDSKTAAVYHFIERMHRYRGRSAALIAFVLQARGGVLWLRAHMQRSGVRRSAVVRVAKTVISRLRAALIEARSEAELAPRSSITSVAVAGKKPSF